MLNEPTHTLLLRLVRTIFINIIDETWHESCSMPGKSAFLPLHYKKKIYGRMLLHQSILMLLYCFLYYFQQQHAHTFANCDPSFFPPFAPLDTLPHLHLLLPFLLLLLPFLLLISWRDCRSAGHDGRPNCGTLSQRSYLRASAPHRRRPHDGINHPLAI